MDIEHELKKVSFPVGLRDVAYLGGLEYVTIPNRKAVIRTDTGEPLSIVSNDYKLMPYEEATKPLLECIEKHGGSFITRTGGRRQSSVRLENNGAKLWIETKFNQEVKIGNDIIVPRVTYGNSYDGTTSLKAIVGFYQVICTNAGALMRSGEVFGLGGTGFNRRHKGPGDELGGTLEDHLRSFLDGFGERTQSLRALANSQVSTQDAMELFKKHCGERALAKHYNNLMPTESAWAFYSRVTNYLTINYKGGQQPMETRAHSALLDVMEKMR